MWYDYRVSQTLENQERRKDMIKRDYYLEKIKDKMWNGAVKIITGASRLWTDDNGISYVGALTFLLDPESVLP